ncbi:bifunctional sulfate adenylyltransferase/adenylylsulfate kinase [Candidatus Neomarinimicrobiota bacterium]
MNEPIIEAYGGELKNLMLPMAEAEAIKRETVHYPSLKLNDRQLCDLELLLNGGFSPLEGFISKADYESVVAEMRLANGALWPIPITLDVSADFAATITTGDKVVLRDHEGFPLAVLLVDDIWEPDLKAEAVAVFGTSDLSHPGVYYLLDTSQSHYIGGKLQGLSLPMHYDYQLLRHTPESIRQLFQQHGWSNVIAFQTRNPMHKAHLELTHRSTKEHGANLLIHPVVGLTKPGDVDHYTRVRCYESIIEKYPTGTAALSLLPLAMRLGGPREAVWHAIIRRNYGCNGLIVGRDHAGPGNDRNGDPFYEPYEAQQLVQKHADEIGIKIIPFKQLVYVEDRADYMPIDEVPDGVRTLSISGTELRRRLDKGLDIPDWFSYPEVVAELRHARPPLNQRGFTVFFTGLSGAGKSTLANGLLVKLLEDGKRPVTLLDGDIVRTNLSSELGFSKEHRSVNVRRIGFVASEITKNGGIAICAPIAPYEIDRQFNRELISGYGGYIEVHISTSLEVCEERDVKGLYALARSGKLKQFTGIDDPYEVPKAPEMTIDSSTESPEILAQQILLGIEHLGYI